LLDPVPHGSGMQVTLRPRGIGRLFQAAFLAVWLGGWAMGEWFALGLFVAGLEGALGPGAVPESFRASLGLAVSRGEAPMVLLIVVPWLVLWTLGGALALGQALLLLVGREVVRWSPEALEIERYALTRLSSRRLEPAAIHAFSFARGALVVRKHGRSIAVARLGTAVERSELATRLETWHRGFGGRALRSPEDPPCPGYQVSRDDTGAFTLVPGMSNRWLATSLLAFVASGFFAMLGFTALDASTWELLGACFALGLPGSLAAGGAIWLIAVRESWHPRSGTLEIRRRGFGHSWGRTITPLRLELRGNSDSDGDLHWTLFAHGAERTQRLASAIHDSAVPESLGEWLSERTGVAVEFTGRAGALRKAA